MATGGLPSVFECAICLHSMLHRTPRGLPCLHSFCEACLEPLIKNGEISCPSCRRSVEVKGNDVKELPVNFLLYQIKEMSIHKQADSDPKRKSKSSCDICNKEDPKHKCEDCSKLFCMQCQKNHSNIKKYANHTMFDLCATHEGSTLQHFCKECLSPMCQICLADHEHKSSIINYEKAVEEFKKSIDSVKEDVNSATLNYDKQYEEIFEKTKIAIDLQYGLQERRKYHTEKAREAEELIKTTEDKIAAFKDFEVKYEKDRFQCEELKSAIEALELAVPKFSCLSQLKLKAAETLKDVKKNIQIDYSLPPFVLYKHSPRVLTVPRPNAEVSGIMKERLLFTLQECDGVGFSTPMAWIGEDILAVTENNSFLKINLSGEATDKFYPEISDDTVKGISVYEEQIYIAQKKLITILSPDKMETRGILKPKITEISGIFVKHSNKILLSEWRKPASVFIYRPMEDEIETVVRQLNGPTCIGILYKETGQHYTVSNSWAHCVNIYNKKWKVVQTIGELDNKGDTDNLFSFPMHTAITEHGTILIADRNNNRVSHFSPEGKFLSYLLTKEDGIERPVCLILKNNILCICNDYGHIKGFQLQ